MKRRNVKDNVENQINGSTRASTPTINKKIIGVGVDALINPLKNRAITLIALIITIIIMLILAGVVLSLTIGENGLFSTAKYAVKKWNNSVEQENAELDELYAYINGENLPENTKDTNAGTLVAVPDSWKTSTRSYVRTSDGKEVVSSKKISTVQAVATGDGETVPVPLGFYYVGGKVDTGVVISDRKEDQNKYKNETEIPSGIEAVLNEDGTVKEIERTLIGNQFVWVPCKIAEYKKCNVWNGVSQTNTNLADTWWDIKTPFAETIQINKYEGFYVARFEAGLSNSIKEIKEIQIQGETLAYNKEGVPQSKAGIVPWNFIDGNYSKENAENMYKTGYVRSGLITGTQWDVMINWMTDKDKTELTTNTGMWANYTNTNPNITLGRIARGYSENGKIKQDPFSKTWSINENKPLGTFTSAYINGYIWTTGASNQAKRKNIYDVAGNLGERTEEINFTGSDYNIARGGSFWTPTDYPVCYRGGISNSGEYINSGFRVVLYM